MSSELSLEIETEKLKNDTTPKDETFGQTTAFESFDRNFTATYYLRTVSRADAPCNKASAE